MSVVMEMPEEQVALELPEESNSGRGSEYDDAKRKHVNG